MFVRMGSFRVTEGNGDELRRTYLGVCAPLVRSAVGNVDCYLLQSATDPSDLVACTIWRSEGDAKAYEASGMAQTVVAKVKHLFAGPPKLQSFHLWREV